MQFSLDQFSTPEKFAALALPILIKIVIAIAIFYLGRILVHLLLRLTTRGLRRAQADETLVVFLNKVLYGLGLAVVIIAALGQLGIATTSAAAVLGGAALAIGLALQNQLASFAAGVLLVIFRPFRVGDWVDAGGKSGTVMEVNIFSTVLHTFENKEVTIPNSKIWGDAITNSSRNPWQRVDLTVSISFNSDLRRARQILEELLSQDARVLKDPAASVVVRALTANSIDFAFRAAATNDDMWPLQCDLLERIQLRFSEAGIQAPGLATQPIYLMPSATGEAVDSPSRSDSLA